MLCVIRMGLWFILEMVFFFSEAHRDMNSSRNKRPQRVGFLCILICTKELMKPTVKVHVYGMICKRSCHNRIVLTDYKNTRGKKALYRPNTNNARKWARALNKYNNNNKSVEMTEIIECTCIDMAYECTLTLRECVLFQSCPEHITSPIALIDLCSNERQKKTKYARFCAHYK